MINNITSTPSFKRASIRENDEITQGHIDDLFNTPRKKKAFNKEMERLDKISEGKDVFLSAKLLVQRPAFGENIYEINFTDKDYNHLLQSPCFSTKDSVLNFKSTFRIMNEMLKQRLKSLR